MGKPRKKIIAFNPLTFMDVQIEIHKAYVYSVLLLSKEYDVTMVIDQAKRYKKYEEFGWLDKLKNNGVKVIFIKNFLLDYSNETKHFETIDYSWLKQFGNGYEEIYIYSPPICGEGYIKASGYKERIKRLKCPFLSMSVKYRSYIICNELIRKYGLKIKHMIVDYLEPRFDKLYDDCVTFGNYDDSGVKSLLLYENYLFRNGIIDKEKEYDFVFGYTVTYAQRKYLSEVISNNIIEDDKHLIFANDRFWKGVGRKDIVNQIEYYDYIAKSKFSFVAPSNNKEEVSYIRILECISRKCIPIISSRVKIEKCFNNFPDLFEFYKKNGLFYDESETINDFIERLDYDELIEEMMELKTIKNFLNKKMMRKEFLKRYGEE